MNVWERFSGIADVNEVMNAKDQFVNIDAGEYNVTLVELKPAETRSGLPCLNAKFKTLESNKTIFFNQNLQNLNNPEMTAVNIANAVAFLEKITGEDITYTNLADLCEYVEGIEMGECYRIAVSYSDRDVDHKFPKVKIIGRLEEDFEN